MRAASWLLVGALAVAHPVSGEWQVTGRVGGLVTAVAAQGSFAYVAVGSTVRVYDVTDSAAPREIGATPSFADDVRDIVVNGDRAYVAAGTGGIAIVDLSERAAPRVLGHWDSPGTAEGVAVDGTWIHVADGPFGLQIVDASDPASPAPAGAAFDTRFAFDVVVRDRYAFIAAADAGLLVVDVTDRARPRELAVRDTPGYARDLAIAGTTLYVADQWGGVRVLSIETPSHPREIAAIPLPSWAFAVTVSENTLHVAGGARGVHTFDVSDPSHPLAAGSSPIPLRVTWKIAVSGGRAFAGVRTEGVRIFDVTRPVDLRPLGSIAPLLRAGWVVARGDLAYVSTGLEDVRVIDVSQPSRMRERGPGVLLDGTAGTIELIGDGYLYIARGVQTGSRLDVYDFRNVEQPAPASSLPLFNFAQELIPSGSLLFMPDEYGLEVADIANPASPVMKGRIAFPPDNGSSATSVALAGQYAFVSYGRSGLNVVDVTDPANMSIVGNWSPEVGGVAQLAYRDGFLYAATPFPSQQLVVLDVADPRRPVPVGAVPLTGRGTGDILLDGPYAYVANGAAGVAVIDIRNPSQPAVVAQIGIPGFATHLAMEGGRLLVTGSTGGLAVVEEGAQPVMSAPPVILSAPPVILSAPPVILSAPPVILSEVEGPGWEGDARAGAAHPPGPSTDARDDRVAARDDIANAGRSVVVTSAADSGSGTLRDALAHHAAGDVITFDPSVFPPAAPVTIQLATVLPHITRDNVVIDASNAGVILDGSLLSGLFESGLEIEEPSKGNVIRGLQIVNFPSCGIFVGGDGGNVIGGDRSRGAGPVGEGNRFSRNVKAGIQVGNPNGNRIVGNLIGTDVTGRVALGRQTVGVNIFFTKGSGAERAGDRIGGYEPWERNVIAGNGAAEVRLHFAGSHSVIGNFIGTDVDGNAVGTAFRAIDIDASSDNLIAGNVVIGNHAMQIIDPGACCNRIAGNWFGTTRDGRIIPRQIDGENGIAINESFNVVFGNVFGGIRYHSVFLIAQADPVVETIIAGNTIVGSSAAQPRPDSVAIGADAVSRTFVGGSTLEFRNVIRGCGTGMVLGQGVSRTFVLGNGIDSDPGTALRENGIDVGTSAFTFVQNNTIANLRGNGVIVGAPANRIRQNSIHGIQESAIDVSPGAGAPAPPVIEEVTPVAVTGTACAGCTIEIFSDTGTQARWYDGSTVAAANGRFTFPRTSLRGAWIRATATDGQGSTSALSAPVAAPPHSPRRRTVRH